MTTARPEWHKQLTDDQEKTQLVAKLAKAIRQRKGNVEKVEEAMIEALIQNYRDESCCEPEGWIADNIRSDVGEWILHAGCGAKADMDEAAGILDDLYPSQITLFLQAIPILTPRDIVRGYKGELDAANARYLKARQEEYDDHGGKRGHADPERILVQKARAAWVAAEDVYRAIG